MGLRLARLWRGQREDVALKNAEIMAWAIEDVLNAHETSPNRGKDPHDVAAVLEGMPGYSPAATEILRRRGIRGVIVVDDERGMRYLVVCGRPGQRPPKRDLWDFLVPAREVVEARVVWRTWLEVRQYYVVPNFAERMSYFEDLVLGGVREAYPAPQNVDPEEFRIAIGPPKGQVYFRDATAALTYADDLRLSMQDRGILCSPVVGISGYTDHPHIVRPMGDTAVEKELGEAFVPAPSDADIDGIAFAVGHADHLERRCAELAARLCHPEIPERRKVELGRQLDEERRNAREAAQRARSLPIQELARVIWHLRAEWKHR